MQLTQLQKVRLHVPLRFEEDELLIKIDRRAGDKATLFNTRIADEIKA